MNHFEKPIVVVSKCLGFDACRYNAQIIEDKFVQRLAPHVNYTNVCPEVEIGMGIPREPVRLVMEGERVKMVQPDTGQDFTDRMEQFSRRYVSNLSEVDGFILKADHLPAV
jgi:uncharacterized protein YbbK (DUF523 family)